MSQYLAGYNYNEKKYQIEPFLSIEGSEYSFFWVNTKSTFRSKRKNWTVDKESS